MAGRCGVMRAAQAAVVAVMAIAVMALTSMIATLAMTGSADLRVTKKEWADLGQELRYLHLVTREPLITPLEQVAQLAQRAPAPERRSTLLVSRPSN